MVLVLTSVCVCQRVEAGWLTHWGTGDCRPRRGQAEHTHMGHGGDTSDYTHIQARQHKQNLPSFRLMCASAGPAPPMTLPQQKPLVFHLWSNRINYTHKRKLMPLVSTLCRLPCVEDDVVNLHWEQWIFCSGVFGRDADAEQSLTMLPSCDCISTSAGCKWLDRETILWMHH